MRTIRSHTTFFLKLEPLTLFNMYAAVLPEQLVIVEARKLIRDALLTVFTNVNVFRHVFGASDGLDPIFLMRSTLPTVFLVAGSSYPQIRETVHLVQTTQQGATIVILDEQFRSGGGLLVRETAAHGYWTFHDTLDKIVDGIIQAANRQQSISPFANDHLNHHRRKGLQLGPKLLEHPLYKLSKRERQLFHLIADGKKIETCATEMSIARKTACNLREKLMKKFNVKSGTDLVWKAVEVGLVDHFHRPIVSPVAAKVSPVACDGLCTDELPIT